MFFVKLMKKKTTKSGNSMLVVGNSVSTYLKYCLLNIENYEFVKKLLLIKLFRKNIYTYE